ncbi:hypothetical protein Q644_23860 [Brucella intermedia 229E]|uniref:Uncharacterized protein n=1 Tax=Brucella intermedia 229E TaxID=1337887 RepID=U4V7K1_9HYPH|nr:hypothetical protein Q644_23860 [Brucella intermedia 229E]
MRGGTLETGLAIGLANLRNVERENLRLVPEPRTRFRRVNITPPILLLPCDMAPISSFGTIRIQGGTGSKIKQDYFSCPLALFRETGSLLA